MSSLVQEALKRETDTIEKNIPLLQYRSDVIYRAKKAYGTLQGRNTKSHIKTDPQTHSRFLNRNLKSQVLGTVKLSWTTNRTRHPWNLLSFGKDQ